MRKLKDLSQPFLLNHDVPEDPGAKWRVFSDKREDLLFVEASFLERIWIFKINSLTLYFIIQAT